MPPFDPVIATAYFGLQAGCPHPQGFLPSAHAAEQNFFPRTSTDASLQEHVPLLHPAFTSFSVAAISTSMRRWVSRNLLARSMPLRDSLILRNVSDKCLLIRYLERLRGVTPRVTAYHANWATLTLEANDPSPSAILSDIFQRPCGRVGIDGAGRDRGAGR